MPTLHSSQFIEQNGDDELYDLMINVHPISFGLLVKSA